jgi:hypothetical protein
MAVTLTFRVEAAAYQKCLEEEWTLSFIPDNYPKERMKFSSADSLFGVIVRYLYSSSDETNYTEAWSDFVFKHNVKECKNGSCLYIKCLRSKL